MLTLVCSGVAARMLTPSCLLIINNTQTPICGKKQLSGSVGFFHAFPLFLLSGNSVGMLEHSSVQYMIVCVCVRARVPSPWRDVMPRAESEGLTDDHKVTRLTDLWSPLETQTHFKGISCSFSLFLPHPLSVLPSVIFLLLSPLCPPFFCLPLFLTLSPLLFALGSHFSFCCLCLCFTIDLLLRHCLSFCFLLYSLISLLTEGITVLLLDVRQDPFRTSCGHLYTISWLLVVVGTKKTGIITYHCPAD